MFGCIKRKIREIENLALNSKENNCTKRNLIYAFAMISTFSTGQWISWDGYVYKIISIRHVRDPLILQRFTTTDMHGEDFLILKKHSKYRGSWTKQSFEIARARQCKMLDKIAQRHVDECNRDTKKYQNFESYETDECFYRLELTYESNIDENTGLIIDEMNSLFQELPGLFGINDVKEMLLKLKNVSIDMDKPISNRYTKPVNSFRLVFYSRFMEVDENGRLLFTEVNAFQ